LLLERRFEGLACSPPAPLFAQPAAHALPGTQDKAPLDEAQVSWERHGGRGLEQLNYELGPDVLSVERRRLRPKVPQRLEGVRGLATRRAEFNDRVEFGQTCAERPFPKNGRPKDGFAAAPLNSKEDVSHSRRFHLRLPADLEGRLRDFAASRGVALAAALRE